MNHQSGAEPNDDAEPGTTAELAAAHAAALAELDELRTSHGMQALREQWNPTARRLGRRRLDDDGAPADDLSTDDPPTAHPT